MPEEGQGTSSSGVSCPSLPGGERRPAGPGGRAGAVEGRWTASFSPPEASRALISVTAESEGARTPWGTPRAPLPPGPGGRGPGAVLQSSGRARRRGRALTGGGGGGAEQEKEEERRRKYKEKAERIIAGEDRPQVKLPAGHYLRKASVAARRRSARLNSAAQAELGVEVPTIEGRRVRVAVTRAMAALPEGGEADVTLQHLTGSSDRDIRRIARSTLARRRS